MNEREQPGTDGIARGVKYSVVKRKIGLSHTSQIFERGVLGGASGEFRFNDQASLQPIIKREAADQHEKFEGSPEDSFRILREVAE